jgi:hypothetical protein
VKDEMIMGKRERKRQFERPTRRWNDNIKMNLKIKRERRGLNSFGLGYVGCCECDDEPSDSIKFGELFD